MQAGTKATARQSFAVTTGTGSGKSLCFFIPMIDAAIRARASGDQPRTRAIVIYRNEVRVGQNRQPFLNPRQASLQSSRNGNSSDFKY
jgi:hypothetical protein